MSLHDKDIREPLFDFLEETYGRVRMVEEKMMGKSRADAVMVMSRTLSPMMVAEYQLQLPDKGVLQKKLQELINMPLLEGGGTDD